MTHMDFLHHVTELRQTITASIEVYLVKHGMNFSDLKFQEGTSADLDQVAKDALFFGADQMPDMIAADVAVGS